MQSAWFIFGIANSYIKDSYRFNLIRIWAWRSWRGLKKIVEFEIEFPENIR